MRKRAAAVNGFSGQIEGFLRVFTQPEKVVFQGGVEEDLIQSRSLFAGKCFGACVGKGFGVYDFGTRAFGIVVPEFIGVHILLKWFTLVACVPESLGEVDGFSGFVRGFSGPQCVVAGAFQAFDDQSCREVALFHQAEEGLFVAGVVVSGNQEVIAGA